MKPRPRHAENAVARELNKIFVPLGYSEFERIPVLGRTGPDLTINETNLVVDVKSRQQCPIGFFNKTLAITTDNKIATIAIENLPILIRGEKEAVQRGQTYKNISPSIMIQRWLDHMNEWTLENHPGGISTIILHRPRLPYGKSMAVFYLSDYEKIIHITNKAKE